MVQNWFKLRIFPRGSCSWGAMPPGTPPSGPAGAGRGGGITCGGIVDTFRSKKLKFDMIPKPPFPKPPYLITLGDQKGGYWGGGVLGLFQIFIFLFRKASTIPPRAITPTRPAPAGPDGGVRGGVAPLGAQLYAPPVLIPKSIRISNKP